MTMACRRHGVRGPRAKRSLLLLDDTTWKLTNPIPTIPSPEVRHRLGPFFLCLMLERFQCNESSVHADGPDSLAKHRDNTYRPNRDRKRPVHQMSQASRRINRKSFS